jgi:FlaG/FlaF family flagellin (archaellin)
MKRNDKRGISAIVATVLIIGITVGVIAIVGNFIIGMVNENLQEGTLCSKAATQVLVKTSDGLTCYNDTTMFIQVAHGANEVELQGLKVYYKLDGSDIGVVDLNTSTLDIGLTQVLSTDLMIKTAAIEADDESPAEDATYYTPDAFAIAPVVGTGNKVCDKSQYTIAVPCN